MLYEVITNAEIRDQLAVTRDFAIQEIGDAPEDEKHQSDGLVVRHPREKHHKKYRRRDKAGNGKFVGQIHR